MNTLKKYINGFMSIYSYKKHMFCALLTIVIFSCGESAEEKSNRMADDNPTEYEDGVLVDSQNR
ncbi:MAG: hypothetical protein PVH87_28020, partial [Desulfobacteraceae bacterium]